MDQKQTSKARGSVRFAPSPTGSFHVGNFRTAWISHELARQLGWLWIVRFEDIDRPRVAPGAMERQLEEMGELGLRADQVLVQGGFHARHRELFLAAAREGQVYPCFCSRKEVQEALQGLASAPHHGELVYNGACRPRQGAPDPGIELPAAHTPTIAWRFRGEDERGFGDFIVARTEPARSLGEVEHVAERSFVPAYHWACAIDDYDGDYGLLVRAWDLEQATPVQREIQAWIARFEGRATWEPPAVFHTALVTDNTGHRLEKRTRGVTWAELRDSGLEAREIARRFNAGFAEWPEAKDVVVPGAVLGESRRSVTLRELGF